MDIWEDRGVDGVQEMHIVDPDPDFDIDKFVQQFKDMGHKPTVHRRMIVDTKTEDYVMAVRDGKQHDLPKHQEGWVIKFPPK